MSFLNSEIETELQGILDRHQCQAGTVHVLSGDQLYLVAAVGLPKQVVQIISVIPIGKGMAGVAAERREPVQICNLQSDDSGLARPGAKATGMEGSIALPMWQESGGETRELKGILGVAKNTSHHYSEEEIARLLNEAGLIAVKI